MATSTIDRSEELTGHELSESCYIDGAWVQGEHDHEADVLNPATEESLVRIRFASGRQIEQAIAAARRAADSGPWRELSPRERSVLLHRLTDLFEARREEYVDLIISEVGSPQALAQAGQVAAAIDTFRWFADAAARGPVGGYEYGLPLHYQPFTSASLLRQEPVGVVAAITAYNFPLFLLALRACTSGCSRACASSAGSSPRAAPGSGSRPNARR